MREHLVTWKCDIPKCENSVGIAQDVNTGALHIPPDGWHYLQATRDNARVYVKLVCKDHFRIMTETFFGFWDVTKKP